MKIGDLIRPKCEHDFKRLGFAMIRNINALGRVIIVWLDDQTNHYMRLWELEKTMEVA